MPWLGLVGGCGPTDPTPFDCDRPGAVCTVMGTGTHGFGGDGRPADRTWLYFPTAVRFEADGRPLIADFNNLRVRSVDDLGRVVTRAGNGLHDDAIDGVDAPATPLDNPVDVWPLPDGGFLLAELHTGRLLAVDASGWLTVAADGRLPVDGHISRLWGVARADDGLVYLADTENHCIRAVDLEAGELTLVTGGPGSGFVDGDLATARFASPHKLHWRDGALFVADQDNHAIRRVDLASGQVTTLAGTGAPGWSGDGGPATAAQLNLPYGLDVGPDGTIWVADGGNHVVRRIGADGAITTAVGIGEPGDAGDDGWAEETALNLPNHVAVAPDGRVWIADTLNSRVRVYVPE